MAYKNRDKNGGAALQTTVWRGMRMATPADWEIAQVSGPKDDGRCIFVDRHNTRLDIRWRTVDQEPNLDVMLEAHLQDASDEEQGHCVQMGSPDWRGVETAVEHGVVVHAGRYFPERRWLAEATIVWPHGRDRDAEQDLLAGLAPEQLDEKTIRWQAMGLRMRMPVDQVWQKCSASVGRVRWDFTCGKGAAATKVSVERLAMPEYWLTGSLATWLRRDLPKSARKVSSAKTTVNGHTASTLVSEYTSKRRGALPVMRKRLRFDVAWLCPVEDRLYRVSHTSPARRAGKLGLPNGLSIDCCQPAPPVPVREVSASTLNVPSPQDTPAGVPESIDDLLAALPVINRAASINRHNDGTAVVTIPVKKPAYLVPPLSWVLPFSSCRNVRLDRLGLCVLDLCAGHRSLESLISEFARNHKLSFREAQLSVTPFLRSLTQRGVLVVAGT